MLELALVLGFIIGFLRGGSLRRLARLDIPYFYLIIAALLVQLSINILMRLWMAPVLAYFLLLSSYLLLLAAVWLNRQDEFLFLVLIGLILNFLVIALNGGMPVSFQAAKMLGVDSGRYIGELAQDFKHVPLLAGTKLKILGDIIPLPRPFPLPQIFSAGDIFISMGVFLFLQNFMYYSGKHRRHPSI